MGMSSAKYPSTIKPSTTQSANCTVAVLPSFSASWSFSTVKIFTHNSRRSNIYAPRLRKKTLLPSIERITADTKATLATMPMDIKLSISLLTNNTTALQPTGTKQIHAKKHKACPLLIRHITKKCLNTHTDSRTPIPPIRMTVSLNTVIPILFLTKKL